MRQSAQRAMLSVLAPAGRRGRLMILSFHRVPEAPDSMSTAEPHAAAFAARMEWLRAYANVLPLPEAARRLQDGSLPARAACITFDDGYRNNLTVAAPILRKLGLPATVFVAVQAVEAGIMWNDRIIEGLRHASGRLDLGDLGLGEHDVGSDEARRRAMRAIIGATKYRPMSERWELAGEIHARCTSRDEPRLMMTRDEVRQLADQGFDIGAHTVNHPILKELTLDEAEREIRESRDWVAETTGQPARSFAYPNGRPGTDYLPAHARLVEEAGFEVAVSTRWSAATRADNLYELPRFTPWEDNAAGFGLRLVKTCLRSYLPGD